MQLQELPTEGRPHVETRFDVAVDIVSYRIQDMYRKRGFPATIGVYGMPNSGKTHFMKKVQERVQDRYGLGAVGMGKVSDTFLETFWRMAQSQAFAGYLFHCPWRRTPQILKENGQVYAEDRLDRMLRKKNMPVDITLYLTRDQAQGVREAELANYNLLVSNPEASIKMQDRFPIM